MRGDGEIDVYSGNFSDYLAKRPQTVEKKEKPEREKRDVKITEKPKKLRFSFKEQREYETIDADLAALEEEKSACEGELEAAGSDYVRLMELGERLEDIKKRLDEKTERWMDLTELAEKIEQQGK